MVNFPFDLDISNFVEYEYSPKKYQLVGTVNRSDANGKEHYISFNKIIDSDKWFCSDDDKINQVNKSEIFSFGIPILLFYNFGLGNQ